MRQVCRERGVTLIELLVVLALFGMMALIGTIQINKTWQRYRLESTASEIRTFVQDAYTEMGRLRTPVFLRLVPINGSNPARLEIARDAAGTTVVRTYVVPDFMSLSTTSITGLESNWPCASAPAACAVTDPRALQVDMFGRTLRADNVQVNAVQWVNLTHRNMVEGLLTPRTRFTLQVYPIWQAISERGLY